MRPPEPVPAFRNRTEAGEQLARRLEFLRSRVDLLVLALPRGGVPVAYPVSQRLAAPLDVFTVRKLGHPAQEELAIGAVASGGQLVLTEAAAGVPEAQVQAVLARERLELERRERALRGERPPPQVRGRTVLVIDDGLATGASMRVALLALRELGVGELYCAVPVAPPETCAALGQLAEVTCLLTPSGFRAVGEWYQDFHPVSDAEVHHLLEQRIREYEPIFPEPAPYP